MVLINKLIKSIFPNKTISHRLCDLINNSSDQSISNSDTIIISIEKDNGSREFCYMTLNELITVYQKSAVFERCLYELILPTNQVKAYIDFEYSIDNNKDIQSSYIGPGCCLKILQYVFNYNQNIILRTEKCNAMALEQFIALESSTSYKISYHFIHGNPTMVFENNTTLGLFIKVMVHYLLYSILQHKCSSFHISLNLNNKYTIDQLITLLKPHVKKLRERCIECQLMSNYFNVAEVAHLIVLNQENEFTLAIDLGVYSKNQQFRLFDCVKKGKNNPLRLSNSFPFYSDCQIVYNDIISKSLVTNIESKNVPIVLLQNHQFVSKRTSTILVSSTAKDHTVDILHDVNIHLSSFFLPNVNYSSISNKTYSIKNNIIQHIDFDLMDNQIQKFISFVQKVITSEALHQGYIYSYARGNINPDVLFFNIGGNYRFCPRKGGHHQQNTVAILVDVRNYTYCIRCKDPQCNNTVLLWNKIE